ncbi:MAG: SusC/RagA family TonB-linked outer membrane protein [Saprospiraceae bacterium]|nr:SusC/RagA family TonB-linked outer membrane protein [Saprospiraceae bacterium]
MKFLHTLTKGGLLAALLLLSGFAMAQRTVTGTVTDAETGDALIGASVSVVGTTRGAATDINGAYRIEVPAGSTQIRFAYTGYAEQVITLGASNTVDVSMKSSSVLDEVVVIGYGAVKKSDATGAVSSVTEKNFNRNAVAPEQLIQGRAAGVVVTNNSGEPGAGINIRIRGTSSVYGSNNPLFVVDGVPLGGGETSGGTDVRGLGRQTVRNPLNFLNPNDIASIDILKDASATAIYGSRGANGVVIITTKSGQSGKGVLEYGYTLGIGQLANKYDLLDARTFLAEWQKLNPGANPSEVNYGGDTDWQEEITQTAMSHSHNLSFGAGGQNGDYRFSLGYLDQDGLILESGIRRLSGRFNGSKKFWDDRLKISTNVTISQTRDFGAPITENVGYEGDAWANALKGNPTWPTRTADGKVFQSGLVGEPSPLAMIELSEDRTNGLRALGNMNAELEITKNLTFKTVLGGDRSISSRKSAYSRDLVAGNAIGGKGRLNVVDVEYGSKLWENYFTYTKTFGSVDFTGLLGYSYQQFEYAGKTNAYSKFSTSELELMINNTATAGVSAIVNSYRSVDELQSYFGRVNFGIKDKYLLTATVRADGSTRFGGDNKYGYFPSAAFKWRITNEEFCPDLFSDLGLRLGYGVTGNQEIGHNLYLSRQRFSDGGIDDGGNAFTGSQGNVAFENPGLKWETTAQINVGLDWGFWNSRLSGSIDYYKKNTTDMLVRVLAAQPAPNEFVWENLDADIENTGVELSLNLAAIDKEKFDWRILGNVAFNSNKVKKFASFLNTGEINGQGLTGAYAQRIAQDQSLFAYFVRDFAGYDSEGIAQYANGLDAQVFVDKSPLPKMTLGITNQFQFGNLDVSIFFTGQYGHYIYNNTANALFTAGALGAGRNVTADVPGSGESRNNAPDVSTRFLEKGDFMRLQDLTIGYNLPLKSKNISGLRIFVSGQNLMLFTDYSGLDPEVNVNKALNGIPSAGIDYNAYPRARNISIGANVTF